MRLGLVLVPVVHIYGPVELSYILRATRAKALVVPSRWRNIDFQARVASLGDLPGFDEEPPPETPPPGLPPSE